MYQVLKGVSSRYASTELFVLPVFITVLLMSGCATLDIDEYTKVEESASEPYQGYYTGPTSSYSNQSGSSALDSSNRTADESWERRMQATDSLYESIRNSGDAVVESNRKSSRRMMESRRREAQARREYLESIRSSGRQTTGSSSGGNSNSGGNGDCFDGKTARQVIAGGGTVCR